MIKNFPLAFFAVVFFAVCAANAQTIGDDKAKNPAATTTAKSFSYGLVIDNSGSQRPILESVIKSAQAVVETNGAHDETFVVRFVNDETIKLIQDFTSSIDELNSALEDLFIEGGQTTILDAVYFSAKHLAERKNAADRQKFLILMTDGEDGKSRVKIENLLKFLKDERIKIYALGLSDVKVHRGLLDKLAKETGGKSFAVEKTSEFENTVKKLTIAARAQ